MSKTNATVPEDDLIRGLDRLEKLAKAQIVGRLEGKSDKGKWSYDEEPVEPAEKDYDVSGDSGEEELEGTKSDTDYKPKTSYRKSVAAGRLRKGREDSEDDEDERPSRGRDDDDDGDDDDAATDEQYKSLIKDSKNLRRGVEISPFLRDLTKSVARNQVISERRIIRAVSARLEKAFSLQQQFNKGLADVLSSMSATSIEQGDLLKAMSAAPARGVKSQLAGAKPIHKAFDGGGQDAGTLPDGSPQLDRATIMNRLMTGVTKGLIGPGEVVKFESTGTLHPALYKSLVSNKQFLE